MNDQHKLEKNYMYVGTNIIIHTYVQYTYAIQTGRNREKLHECEFIRRYLTASVEVLKSNFSTVAVGVFIS